MKETLQIGIPCGRNSELFVEFLISTIERTISGKYNIEYFFGINQTGVSKEYLIDIQTQNKKIIVTLDELSDGKGTSAGHGNCLDAIFQHMNSKYGAVIDCDVAFLYKGWDEKLISLLNEQTIIAGTEYGSDQDKFMGSPNCIMSIFLTESLKKTGIAWGPHNSWIEIDNDESAKVFGKEIGDKIFLDTSYRIPIELYKHGLSSVVLPLNSPRIDKTKVKFMTEDMRGEEYQLDGVPILTHLGRGLIRDFAKNTETVLWKENVEDWIKNSLIADGKIKLSEMLKKRRGNR